MPAMFYFAVTSYNIGYLLLQPLNMHLVYTNGPMSMLGGVALQCSIIVSYVLAILYGCYSYVGVTYNSTNTQV